MNIIIIGAGISGLATAALLAKSGVKVLVLEKNSDIGGRARVLEKNGFRFDMGPSWFLMPEIFQDFYKRLDKDYIQELSPQRLDPSYRVFWGKNDFDDVFSDEKKLGEIFEKYEKGSSAKLEKYLNIAKTQYEVSKEHILYKDFNSIFDIFNLKLIIAALKLKVHLSLDKFVSKFFKSDKIRKLLEYSIVFLGGTPNNTPGLYSMINYIDYKQGVFYPKNGIFSIISSLEKIIIENGGEIRTESEVIGFDFTDNSISSVITKDKKYESSIVISAGDLHHLETKLLPKRFQSYKSNFWKKADIAPSAFIIYIGLKRKLKNIEHHNLFFKYDWQEHFEDIFDRKILPDKPSIYMCIPSKTDNNVAPENFENLFITVPIPPGIKIEENEKLIFRNKIIKIIEESIDEEFNSDIIFEEIYAIDNFESDYNAFQGTALGLSHTLKHTLFMRPRRKSKHLSNLYFTGQYTHPGIGLPMGIISAELTYQKIINEIGQKNT